MCAYGRGSERCGGHEWIFGACGSQRYSAVWSLDCFCFAGVITVHESPIFRGIKQCNFGCFALQNAAGLGLVNIMTSLSVWNLQTSFFWILETGRWWKLAEECNFDIFDVWVDESGDVTSELDLKHPHIIHVRYSCLHLPYFYGRCKWIYHSWIVWDLNWSFIILKAPLRSSFELVKTSTTVAFNLGCRSPKNVTCHPGGDYCWEGGQTNLSVLAQKFIALLVYRRSPNQYKSNWAATISIWLFCTTQL